MFLAIGIGIEVWWDGEGLASWGKVLAMTYVATGVEDEELKARQARQQYEWVRAQVCRTVGWRVEDGWSLGVSGGLGKKGHHISS
jgi:hypothetical protein